MTVDPMFMIVQSLRSFLTAVTPTAVNPTALTPIVVILPEFTNFFPQYTLINHNLQLFTLIYWMLPAFTGVYLNLHEFT